MWRFMALQWPTAATFRRAATDNLPQLPSWAAAVRAPAAASQPLLGWHSSSSLTLVPPRQRLTAFTKYFLGFSAVALASSQTQEGQLIERARLAWLIPTRLARDVYAAATIVADYKVTLGAVPADAEPAARDAALRGCHERGAVRLLDLCFANGGIYIKLGQHIGQLDHLLPEEYVVTMRQHLLDRCPVSSWAEVARTVREDLGAPPEVLFASFDRVPIASASLAQVHVARGHDGRKLAVKVQHAGLRESCTADVATIEFLVAAARRVFPDFDYSWLVDEIKTNLPLELDFRHEADNADRCRANLASSRSTVARSVHVPEVLRALSSARVLTMEFIDGARVTDREALAELGVSPRALAALVSRTFAEMIFLHGDVHCDPHAANMLVRRAPGGGPQLVLLDHGLYRRIDDAFRRQYAALWRALILADREGIRMHATALNAGEAYPLFAAMLTMRPWDQVVDPQPHHLAMSGSRDEKQMLQGYAAIYARQISDLLLRMPRPLLLLLKTNDCLRSVDLSLGAPVNTFLITAHACSRALAEPGAAEDVARVPGTGSLWRAVLEPLRVELALAAMRALSAWAALRRALGLTSGSSSSSSSGASSSGNGGVVYDEALLERHRAAARAGIVLAAAGEDGVVPMAAAAAVPAGAVAAAA